MKLKIPFLGASALGVLIAGGSAAEAGPPMQLPPGLLGAQMQVFSAPLLLGATHVFAVVTTGPYTGYVVENTSAAGPHVGTGADYDTWDDTRATAYLGTFTITNTTVASGYDLGTNNCSDLMTQLTQSNNTVFYPGSNWLTWPFSVAPPGQEIPLDGTTAGQVVTWQLQSDATVVGTSYDEYTNSPGYGGGGESGFYETASSSGDDGGDPGGCRNQYCS